jgi:hypothetical protein
LLQAESTSTAPSATAVRAIKHGMKSPLYAQTRHVVPVRIVGSFHFKML